MIGAIDEFTASIDVKMVSLDEQSKFLNTGIERTSKSIEAVDKELDNIDLSMEERVEIVRKRTTFYEMREVYFGKLDEVDNARETLQEKKSQLNDVRN